MATITATVDPFPYVTAGLTALGAIVKLTDDELAYLNSPQMIQARINVQNQAQRDKIAADADAGLKPGADLTQVEKDLS
jgi:hypothetical protein